MKNTLNRMLFIVFIALELIGCTAHRTIPLPQPLPASVPIKNPAPTPSVTSVHTTFGLENDPAIVNAYHAYQLTGHAQAIVGKGWRTVPYSPHHKPIIACSVFHFCLVQLEAGETLNAYSVGDTAHWRSSAFLTGTGSQAALSLQFKPAQSALSTDVTISTNKRTYVIGLVAKAGAGTAVLRFYYPEATQAQEKSAHAHVLALRNQQATSTLAIPLSQLHTNYRVTGNNPPWKPLQVFDDGQHSYIALPAQWRGPLPQLRVSSGNSYHHINTRYQPPYLITEGVWSTAWLTTGQGAHRQTVILHRLPNP